MLVNGKPTLQATTALDANLRVVLSSGKLVAASATQDELGTTDGAALDADKYVAVLPRGTSGVRKFIASKAIAQYAEVFTAADGKVTDTTSVGAFSRGIALEAASGDGSVIPVFYSPESVAQ